MSSGAFSRVMTSEQTSAVHVAHRCPGPYVDFGRSVGLTYRTRKTTWSAAPHSVIGSAARQLRIVGSILAAKSKMFVESDASRHFSSRVFVDAHDNPLLRTASEALSESMA